MRIKNIGKHPLDIRLQHIALVMSHFNRAKWSPPKHSRSAARRPYKTTYRGKRVWIVPANPEGAYDDLPPKGNRSFATHWNVNSSLAPGKTFHPVRHKKGDAVVYVPKSGEGVQLSGVLGLAYVDGPHISVICPPDRWGPKVAAEDF